MLQCIRQGQVGGGESHLLTLIEHLDKDRFDPLVLSFTDGPMVARLQAAQVPVEVIATTRPFDVTRWQQVYRWMAKKAPHLVHAHGTRAHSNVFWAARKLKLPVLYTIHGWSFHEDQSFFKKRLRTWGERYLTQQAHTNISVSESNRQTGLDQFAGFQSVVVPNGINLQRFEKTEPVAALRNELDTPVNAVVVLFLARLTHQKQPLALLEAFAAAAAQNPNLYLWMIGDGELKTAVQDWVTQSTVGARVRLQGFRADVPALLQAADVFVLPSLWEGMPIALLEAMAAAKAIIATRVDGTKELLQHTINGWLIDTLQLHTQLTEALLLLGSDPALRSQLAARARSTVAEGYDAVSMTRKIESLYLKTVLQ